jgi:hypothetical protein
MQRLFVEKAQPVLAAIVGAGPVGWFFFKDSLASQIITAGEQANCNHRPACLQGWTVERVLLFL